MIPKASFSRINYVSTHSLPPQENIAAASFVNQMPLPLDSDDDDVFFDAEEEPEISQEEADRLDAEADALDEETETSLDHPFVKAIINMLIVPAMPITAGMRMATYLATYHPRSLRVGLALMEATSIATTPLKAWQDVKSAKKSIDPQKKQQEKNPHKRSLDDPQKNATMSSSPSFSEDHSNSTSSAIHPATQIHSKGHRLVGDCMKDFYSSSPSNTEHRLFHICCTPTELQIKDECLASNSQNSTYHFSSYGEDLSLTTINSANCSQPFTERSKDPRSVACLLGKLNEGCLLHFAKPNTNGTENHILFNKCNHSTSVILDADCSPNGEQQFLHLDAFSDSSFLIKKKSKCKHPIFTTAPDTTQNPAASPITRTTDDPAVREEILKVLSSPKSASSFMSDTYPICEAIEYAELSEYAYCCKRAHLPNYLSVRELSRGWSLNPKLTQKVASGLKGEYVPETGLFQTKEGLVSAVVEKEGKTCVLFGGTTSVAENESNSNIASAQWQANTEMVTGMIVPTIYLQAATAAETVKRAIGDKPLCTVGHSLGGGLANFAAAMAGTPDSPVKAYGFCSAQINRVAKEMIANKCNTPEEATSLVSEIKNVAISGDPVSSGSFLNSNLGVLGLRVDIKQAPSTEGGWSRYLGIDVDYAHNAYIQHITANPNAEACFDPNKCTEVTSVMFSLTEQEYIKSLEAERYMGREPKVLVSFKNRCHKAVDVGLSTVCDDDEVKLSLAGNSRAAIVEVERGTCLELQRKGKRGIKFNNRYKD